MLENLRDKILNVQHDLSTSIRNLTTGENQASRGKKQNYKEVSQNAGGSMLHHYQELWKELHESDAYNAKKAEEVDSVIGNLHSFCFDHLSVVRQLNIQLAALPQLQTSIMDLMSKIGELEGVFEEVEDALMNLEDVIETQELQERQLDHRFQLAMYKEKKLADFEDMKVKLGEVHAHKVFEYEKKQEAILKERQNTFQEVFEEEVQQYKTHGELRKRVSSTSSAEASVSLEEIDLEEDASALNDFLGDVDANETAEKDKADGSSENDDEKAATENKPPISSD
ncbi:dysbindin-A-like [Uloborus diversus]|uniref:dysbindin-A-like n=1 Tax=Uloborus diversus TaxID=327109 RepID=UPI00240A3833|nr:dysbindin-A-like [Uloborus diversus]